MSVPQHVKQRYLDNPHLTLDSKRRKQLELDGPDGAALELPNLEVYSVKEVITRKRADGTAIEPTHKSIYGTEDEAEADSGEVPETDK